MSADRIFYFQQKEKEKIFSYKNSIKSRRFYILCNCSNRRRRWKHNCFCFSSYPHLDITKVCSRPVHGSDLYSIDNMGYLVNVWRRQ